MSLKTRTFLALLAVSLPGLSGCGKPLIDNLLGTPGGTSNCAAYSVTESAGSELALRDQGTGNGELAQSFSVPNSISITQVELKLIKLGDPGAATVTLRIESNGASQPSGALIASNATAAILATTISTTASALYTFPLVGPTTLSPGTVYWLRLTASYGPGTLNLVKWMNSGTDIYGLGNASTQNLTTSLWTAQTSDFLFRLGCPQ